MMMRMMMWLFTMCLLVTSVAHGRLNPPDKPKKFVLIAGVKSHGPGVHEYEKSVRLLKAMLDTSPNLRGVVTEYHLNGWPEDPATLDDADTIMTISDGQDGDLFSAVPWMTEERMAVMRRQMARGCGFITFHFSTFAPDDIGKEVLEWGGGYFDWQDETGARNWYSAITTLDTQVELAAPDHPINRGIKPLKLREEFYHKIRFRENDPRLTPIWNVPALENPTQSFSGVVAWAVERTGGGRGFGTTTGHFYDNWEVPDYRKMILNAIVWSAGAEVPPGGVESRYFEDDEVAEMLDGEPIRALILTGHQHPAHDWRATTPVLRAALEQDPRLRVEVTEEIEDLARTDLTQYDLLLLNYCNWERPGLSEASKEAFTNYLSGGGGLVLVHFANGAFHRSLPGAGAGDSDWPEFRKICRRVWDHDSDSSHDPYGPFRVEITGDQHPITAGMIDFETTDELYFNQKGEEPITPLVTARSQVTGRDEPLGWAYDYGRGRVFQTLLGHDAASLRVGGVAQLIRRGAVWAAGRAQVEVGVRPVEEAAPSGEQEASGQEEIGSPQVLAAQPALDGGLGGHWGVKTDADWVDNRMNDMDHGPVISCSLETPGGVVTKALVLALGEKGQGAVCFDTQSLSFRAGWTGGTIKFMPARFGLIERPVIEGDVQFTAPTGAGGTYRGLHLAGKRVVVSYEVPGAAVLDAPWIETLAGQAVFTRTIEVNGVRVPTQWPLAEVAGEDVMSIAVAIEGCEAVALKQGDRVTLIAARGAELASEGGRIKLELALGDAVMRVWQWSGEAGMLQQVAAAIGEQSTAAAPALRAMIEGDRPRWGEPVATSGSIAADEQPYVIDTITVPYENPYKALMFLSGVDFFSNGDAAVSSVHGDVWIVSGIDDDLDRITWRRFATGLYQPLGLKIVDDRVYVTGRDRITRLHDTNADGEADYYECFYGGIDTSPDRHQYVADLEIDDLGRFYYIDPKGLHRVEADASGHETLATGWRNPVAMGIGPGGVLTVAPQEGEWTPASMICEVKERGYYGYGGPRVSEERPLGYDPPLVYMPRKVDNSTGDQVWVTSDQWGPLKGRIINLSFGASSMQLVLRDRVEDVAQGAVVPLAGRFLSGAMRGRFHPLDGQLYVAAMNGWVTNAIADGAFQRVRYTGMPAHLPVALRAHENGVRITFTDPLDPAVAGDVGNYSVSRWNYRYSAEYGSRDYSAALPDREGHDLVRITSARVLDGGRSVFLEIPSMIPVHQMRIRAAVEGADGRDATRDLYATIHRLAPALNLPAREFAAAPREEFPQGLERGLTLHLKHRATGATDARAARTAALYVPADETVSPFLQEGPFTARWEGYLDLPHRDDITFAARGRGHVRVTVDGRTVLEGSLDGETALTGPQVRVSAGPRRFLMEYRSPDSGDAQVRLYWQGRGFTFETIAPTSLLHDPTTPALMKGESLRSGRAAFAEAMCVQCHRAQAPGDVATSEWRVEAPSLMAAGDRLSAAWLERWMAGERPGAHSCPLPGNDAEGRDIAAFLIGLNGQHPGANVPASDPGAHETGRKLFAEIGCAACHIGPEMPRMEGEARSLLDHVPTKWRAARLARYLHPDKPSDFAHDPRFDLSREEAVALSAYLQTVQIELQHPSPAPGDAARGRAFAAAAGCAACHALPVENELQAPSLEAIAEVDWALKGCLADDHLAAVPRLALDDRRKDEIIAFAREALASVTRSSPIEAAQYRMAQLQCAACHSRDGQASRWSSLPREEDEGDEYGYDGGEGGTAILLPPDLTFAGEKLHRRWIEELLAGGHDHRVRPWMPARMPAFPKDAALLARGIAFDHGIGGPDEETASSSDINPEENPVSVGEALLRDGGGLGCITCHSVGEEPARMQLAFGVINLQHAALRLRPEYYMRWMLSPQRIDPLTPMPAFADETGRTALTTHFKGDGRMQFEAIRLFLEDRFLSGGAATAQPPVPPGSTDRPPR